MSDNRIDYHDEPVQIRLLPRHRLPPRHLRRRTLHRPNPHPRLVARNSRRQGATEQVLLASYPSLRAKDLANAWNYARAFAADVNLQITENDSDQ